MMIDRVARRYAQAAFDTGVEQKSLDVLLQDFRHLRAMYDEVYDFRVFLRSPEIPHVRKLPVFRKLLAGQVSDTTVQFMELLTMHSREANLPGVVAAFEELYNQAHNITPAHVTTAAPLTEGQRLALTDKLARQLNTTIVLTETVDPTLIGGLVVRIGHHLYDGSVAAALRNVSKTLKSTPAPAAV